MSDEIELTEQEIAELSRFSMHNDMLKDMMDHVFDRMEDYKVKNAKLQRKWWIKMKEKYDIDLVNGIYTADSIRGVIKVKERG